MEGYVRFSSSSPTATPLAGAATARAALFEAAAAGGDSDEDEEYSPRRQQQRQQQLLQRHQQQRHQQAPAAANGAGRWRLPAFWRRRSVDDAPSGAGGSGSSGGPAAAADKAAAPLGRPSLTLWRRLSPTQGEWQQQQQEQQQNQQALLGGGGLLGGLGTTVGFGSGGGAAAGQLQQHPEQQQQQQQQQPQQQPSGYMALVPLSDARLRPRRTRLLVSSLLLLAALAAGTVFTLVPRGVTVGSIQVHSTRMTFNASTLTYRIVLQADVPISNPNYLRVAVAGNVSVSFFDAEAGSGQVGPAYVRRRTADPSAPAVLSAKIDASNLPRRYTEVVVTHCLNFPHRLIFFLLGEFRATYLGYALQLPKVDTYFVLACSGSGSGSSNGGDDGGGGSSGGGSEEGAGGGDGGAAAAAAAAQGRRVVAADGSWEQELVLWRGPPFAADA